MLYYLIEVLCVLLPLMKRHFRKVCQCESSWRIRIPSGLGSHVFTLTQVARSITRTLRRQDVVGIYIYTIIFSHFDTVLSATNRAGSQNIIFSLIITVLTIRHEMIHFWFFLYALFHLFSTVRCQRNHRSMLVNYSPAVRTRL